MTAAAGAPVEGASAMSAEGKWTAGPWEIGTSTRGYEVCTVYQVTPQPNEEGEAQAWVYIYPARVIGQEWVWPTPEQQMGNARLIAAAPDMAEALREIDSEAASKEPPTGRTSDDPDEAFHEGYVRGLWEAATRARAALAKGGA